MAGSSTPRVAVVHHSTKVQEILKGKLTRRGFQTVLTTDINRAATLCRLKPVDCVIIDLDTTGQDGVDLFKTMQRSGSVKAGIFLCSAGQERWISNLDPDRVVQLNKPLVLGPVYQAVRGLVERAVPSQRIVTTARILVSHTLKPLFSSGEIQERVKRLGERISVDYAGRELLVVAVLHGAAMFVADLVRNVQVPITLDFLRAASYGPSTVSTGVVQIRKDVETPVLGRDVLIVEDIVDTGLTAKFLVDHLSAGQPRSVEVCTLLDKPSRRQTKLTPKYVGFEIGDVFVVGYGMDYNEQYRQLPGIYSIPQIPVQ